MGLEEVRILSLFLALGKPSKNKKSESWDIVPTGGGGSDQEGMMSQPPHLVGDKACPNQLI